MAGGHEQTKDGTVYLQRSGGDPLNGAGPSNMPGSRTPRPLENFAQTKGKKNQDNNKTNEKTKRVPPNDPPLEKQQFYEHPTDEQNNDDEQT